MSFNGRQPDPRDLKLHWREYGGIWYLEWRATGPLHSRAVTRRKAHDTEIALIKRILELESGQVTTPKLRNVRDLKLKKVNIQP